MRGNVGVIALHLSYNSYDARLTMGTTIYFQVFLRQTCCPSCMWLAPQRDTVLQNQKKQSWNKFVPMHTASSLQRRFFRLVHCIPTTISGKDANIICSSKRSKRCINWSLIIYGWESFQDSLSLSSWTLEGFQLDIIKRFDLDAWPISYSLLLKVWSWCWTMVWFASAKQDQPQISLNRQIWDVFCSIGAFSFLNTCWDLPNDSFMAWPLDVGVGLTWDSLQQYAWSEPSFPRLGMILRE